MCNAVCEIRAVVILLASPLIILMVHAAATRILRDSSQQKIAFKSILFGYIPTGLLLWFFVFRRISSLSGLTVTAGYSFIVYSAFAYTYFHFFNMSETARRIRILHEIYKAGALHTKDMSALYKTSDIIGLRLKRLIALKQLKYEDGYYSVTGKTLYLAGHLILLLRKILRLKEDSE